MIVYSLTGYLIPDHCFFLFSMGPLKFQFAVAWTQTLPARFHRYFLVISFRRLCTGGDSALLYSKLAKVPLFLANRILNKGLPLGWKIRQNLLYGISQVG